MIEVLWIDDECMTNDKVYTPMGENFVNIAYDKGIKVTSMTTYSEGINEIKTNPLKWIAIILDIHNQKATIGKPSDDFDKARNEIIRIQADNKQLEPYIFVLSGNKQYHTENSILSKPDYCSKNVYDKNNGDYEIMFDDILKLEKVSSLYQCQCQFSDVLKNLHDFCVEDTERRMLELLYKIITKDAKKDSSLVNEMRKILEDIKDGLKRLEYSYFKKTNEEISLNNLSVYIGGDKSVPEYIKRSFHSLTRILQDGSHSKTVTKSNYNYIEVDTDILNSRAPYLLKSCIYELCNIIIWMRHLYKSQREIC